MAGVDVRRREIGIVEGTEDEDVRMTRFEGWRVLRILWASGYAVSSGTTGAVGSDARRGMEIV